MPRVGFWRSSEIPKPGETYTEFPIANSATENQEELLQAIAKVERAAISWREPHSASDATVMCARGHSPCRLCGCMNGYAEYTYRGFIWPSGYAHYLRDHRVAIDPEFKNMLCNM